LMEAGPDKTVVVNQDEEIVLLNARAEKQFGYRRDELLCQKVTSIILEGRCRTAESFLNTVLDFSEGRGMPCQRETADTREDHNVQSS